METAEYKKKLEQELIKQFSDTFFEKLGYYPIVITNKEYNSSYKVLTLNELEQYFIPFTPHVFGKKTSLSSKNRTRPLVELRFIFFFIARQMRYSLLEIGQYLGKRDHTTVIHGLSTFKNLYQTDVRFKAQYEAIINQIKHDHEPSAVEYLDKMEFKS